MRRLVAVVFTLAVALGTTSSAEARGGCGPGWHPGPYGHHCFRNAHGAAVVIGPRVGVYVTGRGYWDGHRYWWHRERWRGGWRYR